MLWQALGVMPGFWGGGRWGETDGAAHTKDLLDSRSVVYYSLTQTIYDSLSGYARFCVRPMAGYPQTAVGRGRNEVGAPGHKETPCRLSFSGGGLSARAAWTSSHTARLPAGRCLHRSAPHCKGSCQTDHPARNLRLHLCYIFLYVTQLLGCQEQLDRFLSFFIDTYSRMDGCGWTCGPMAGAFSPGTRPRLTRVGARSSGPS